MLLLIKLFRFLAVSVDNQTIQNNAVYALYKGVIRSFLVILHDFPDFLVKYSMQLADQLQFHLVQLKNIILGAYPSHLTIENPETVERDTLEEAFKSDCEVLPIEVKSRKSLWDYLDHYFSSKSEEIVKNMYFKFMEQFDQYSIIILTRKSHFSKCESLFLPPA